MDIVIHGTKDGYRNLYTTNDELARVIARDVRRGAQGDEQLGKTAYSLSFVNGGVVYTKYVVVKDSLRSFATGTIAFSLFIGCDEVMKGNEILKLLNELYGHYESKYIKNNYLNRGETVLIREDWTFVKEILGKYNVDPRSRRQEEMTGTEAPAFIYYPDDDKLLEYFDSPFQPEYNKFSQILLIQSDLQGITNPINVLKNSGVELKNIDLKNKYYYLNNYNRSKGVTITAGGKPRSDGKYNNSIRAKDLVKIFYSKDEQCYEPIEEEGTLSDPNSGLYKYIETKGENLIIKYDAFKPVAKTKTILFDTTDYSGKSINDIEIQIGDQQPWKTVSGNQIQYTFEGEELRKRWLVSGKKGDFLGEKIVVPLNLNEGEKIALVLEEKKTVKINVIDEKGDNINGFKIWINDGKGYRNDSEITFKNEDIRKKWNVQISKTDGKVEYSGEEKDYCPATDENPLYITLKKSEKTTGKNNAPIDERTGKPEKNKSFWSNPLVIASSSVGILLLIVLLDIFIWPGWLRSDSTQKELSLEQITQYVKGDSLLADRLQTYKGEWNNQKPEIEVSGGEWWTMFGIGREAKTSDSTAYKNWENVSQSIDNAIAKRQLVDSADFAKLKNQQYSDQQQNFKNAINSLDSVNYSVVKNKLGDVSLLTLRAIADSIKNILSPPTSSQEGNTTRQNETAQTESEPKPTENPTQPQQTGKNVEAKPSTSTIQNASSGAQNLPQGSLATAFFDLVKSGDTKRDSYIALKNKYPGSSGEVFNYLKEVTKDSESFKKFRDIPEFKRKTAKTIADLKKHSR